MHYKLKQGFTLVELSIVLVILGLLVGGVLAGQSLIRSAELRAIIREKDQYVVALNAFKEKYMAIPGDMANAYAFWGATCGTNTTAIATGCNGDGDGIIQYATSENVKAWEHLSRAGLIEGSFDGTGSIPSAAVALAANNTPQSKFSQGYWNIADEPCESCGMGSPDYSPSGGSSHLLLAVGSLKSDDDQGWVYPLT